MKKLMKKAGLFNAIIAIVIVGFTFISFYAPLEQELEKSYLENFRVLALSKFQHIHHFIDRGIEAAKSLASRTVIKEKIMEYENGEMDIHQLRQSTQPRYEDGVDALENVIGACRVTHDVIIAQYGSIPARGIEGIKDISQLQYDVRIQGKNSEMVIYSPIMEGDHILGYDIIYFDMTQYIHDIVDEGTRIRLSHGGDFQGMIREDTLSEEHEGVLLTSDQDIGFLFKIEGIDHYIYIYTTQGDLYGPARRIANDSFGIFIIGLIIVSITINYILLKNANKIIRTVEFSRNQYRDKVYKDALTGVYSREFLDQWEEKVFNKNRDKERCFTIAMIDGDNFKEINDTYGHAIGDQVLIKLAEILRTSVRESDIVLRYGGDEFVVIFENCHRDVARRILQRIQEKLKETKEFGFSIHISYGIYEMDHTEELLKGLHKADRRMYHYKQKNKDAIMS